MGDRITDGPDPLTLARTDWFETEVAGATRKTAIIHGPVDGEDANNNPTPDTTAFPPADFPLGTLLSPTGFLATLASGDTIQGTPDMLFRREGGSGSEEWVWIEGSYRASNSDGEYERQADGRQTANVWGFITADGGTNPLTSSPTWPATFTAITSAPIGTLGRKDGSDPTGITDWDSPAFYANLSLVPGLSSGTVNARHTDGTTIASGLRIGWSAVITGEWQ